MFVEAYSTTTGKKRMIPEHWLTSESPNIRGRFTTTPKAKAKADSPPARKTSARRATPNPADADNT